MKEPSGVAKFCPVVPMNFGLLKHTLFSTTTECQTSPSASYLQLEERVAPGQLPHHKVTSAPWDNRTSVDEETQSRGAIRYILAENAERIKHRRCRCLQFSVGVIAATVACLSATLSTSSEPGMVPVETGWDS